MDRTLIILAPVLVLALTACGDGGGPQPTASVRGTVLIVDRAGVEAAGPGRQGFYCQGRGRYAGVTRGARLEVRDSDGHPVATGRLGLGRMTVDLDRMPRGGSAGGIDQGCQIGFAVPGVPPVGRGWSLRLGQRTYALVASEGGDVEIVLG